ncbi:hypothetical protein AB1N83_010327 [Pleurotus pulmonarius]
MSRVFNELLVHFSHHRNAVVHRHSLLGVPEIKHNRFTVTPYLPSSHSANPSLHQISRLLIFIFCSSPSMTFNNQSLQQPAPVNPSNDNDFLTKPYQPNYIPIIRAVPSSCQPKLFLASNLSLLCQICSLYPFAHPTPTVQAKIA